MCVHLEFCPSTENLELFGSLWLLIDYFNSCFVNVMKQFIEISCLSICLCKFFFVCVFVFFYSVYHRCMCLHGLVLINWIWCLNPITNKLYNRCKKKRTGNGQALAEYKWNECKKKHDQSINRNSHMYDVYLGVCVCVWSKWVAKEKQSDLKAITISVVTIFLDEI